MTMEPTARLQDHFVSCILFFSHGISAVTSNAIPIQPTTILRNTELKYGIIFTGSVIPSGTAIKLPILPERYSPSEIDKYITPITVVAIATGESLDASDKTTGPIQISPISKNK